MAFVRQKWRERALEYVEGKHEVLLDGIVEMVNRELTPLLTAMRAEVNRLGGDPRTLTATGDVLRTDRTIFADGTDGAITLTLPPAADVEDQHFYFKKVDAVNGVTLAFDGTETVDGQTTYALASVDDGVEIVSDGTNYNVVFKDSGRLTGGVTVDVTTTYTVRSIDEFVRADATAGAFAVTLRPSADAVSSGVRRIIIKKIDNVASVTITAAGADDIDGASTATLTSQYESVELWPRGNGYDIA
jgi:hypothetical protein